MLHFETTLDLFWFSMTVLILCLTFLLSLLLIRVIGILGDVKTTTSFVKETSKLINEYAWKPVEVMIHLKEFLMKNIDKNK